MTKGNWVFEQFGGHIGYRCHNCGKWCDVDDVRACRCDSLGKPEDRALAVESLTALELLKMVNDKGIRLWGMTTNDRPGIGHTWDVVDLLQYHEELSQPDISLLATDPNPMTAVLKAMQKTKVKF